MGLTSYCGIILKPVRYGRSPATLLITGVTQERLVISDRILKEKGKQLPYLKKLQMKSIRSDILQSVLYSGENKLSAEEAYYADDEEHPGTFNKKAFFSGLCKR